MELLLIIIVVWVIASLSGSSSNASSSNSSEPYKPRVGNRAPYSSERVKVRSVSPKTTPRIEKPRRSPRKDSDAGAAKTITQLSKTDDFSSPVARKLRQKGIAKLWYMADRANIPSIVKNGILSHSETEGIIDHTDISNHDVQRWRTQPEPINGRLIHEYAPTYLNIRNPMLYVRRNLNSTLCILEVSLDVLKGENFIFTDGNAASRDTNFYNKIGEVDNLPWEVLNAPYWNNFPDGRRKRCAEMLIYPKVDIAYIKVIHCYSAETEKFLSHVDCETRVSQNLFF